MGRAGTESAFFVMDTCVNCLFLKKRRPAILDLDSENHLQ